MKYVKRKNKFIELSNNYYATDNLICLAKAVIMGIKILKKEQFPLIQYFYYLHNTKNWNE